MSAAGLPILLCCAEENEAALAKVCDALQDEGMRPEILVGVDLDSSILADSVDQNPGAALYVVVQSEDLDKYQVRRLEGIFSARSGPAHRLITIKLNSGRPLTVLPWIRRGAAQLTRPEGQGRRKVDEGMRDVVGEAAVHAVSRPAEIAPNASAEDMARMLKEELEAAEALLDKRQARGHESPIPASKPIVEVERPVLAAPAAPATVEEPSIPPIVEPSSQRPGRSSAPLVALIGAGVILAVVFLLVWTGRQPDEAGTRGAAKSKQPRVIAPAKVDRKQTTDPAKQPTGDGKAPVVEGKGGVQDDGKAPPDEGEMPPDEGKTPAGDTAAASGEGGTPQIPTKGADDRIATAIAEGRMRALDLYLVLHPSRNTMEWKDAANYCRRKRVGGLRGWRLPTLRELKKLRKARMLRRRIALWSQTLAGSRDEVMVLDLSTGKYVTWLKVEPTAHAICIRKR